MDEKWFPGESRVMFTFLDVTDEQTLFEQIQMKVPDVYMIDGDRWPTPEPPRRSAPGDCRDGRIYFYSPTAIPLLPEPVPRRTGIFDGPVSRVVIQWSRSGFSSGELRSGHVAVGYDPSNGPMLAFVDEVFAALRDTTVRAEPVRGGIKYRNYRVGHSASARARAGEIRLRHRSNEYALFAPADA